MNVQRKHKGALAELGASTWLLNEGYEVFRNVSQHGAVDIIARHPVPGAILLIDVKTGPLGETKRQVKEGIRVLEYNQNDGSCTLH
jgi:Holliday junction resolvase-like predicted endonuclease